jgi:hypothetical protein
MDGAIEVGQQKIDRNAFFRCFSFPGLDSPAAEVFFQFLRQLAPPRA